jgi:hypothetical protein
MLIPLAALLFTGAVACALSLLVIAYEERW